MKFIQYSEHGSDYDEILQLVTSPDDDATSKTPPPGFATVKIVAASGNPIDFKVAQGGLKEAWDCPLPMTMGYDFSGEIFAVSDGESNLKVGDEVFAVNWGQNQHKPAEGPLGGAFAEYITIPVATLSKKPTGVTHQQAAAVALVGTTAYECLFDCMNIKEGDKVLILGGPTAVGSLAIQLAKNAGAWVATTASPRNMDYVKSLGPDLIINYRESDWSDHPDLIGIDAVFDAVGEDGAFGKISAEGSKVVKEGGQFVSIASFDAGFDPAAHKPRFGFASFFCLYNSAMVQDKLAVELESGKLKVSLDKTFPFSKEGAVEMMKYIESGKGRGKNVMTIAV
uniref:Enoyl reductase (ER) domain-containing protein n=1 Tax=Minutocellus polymorphus TaxID=265543 RepID=A0A6U0K0N9_9STRA|mmetsp:Transcript_2415/g.4096  ORF Transcript_2415/g.4096 Transcript_2415/m.4096 type:complete len:339 (+) Transcript_2415:161-1177(+)